MSFDQIRSMSQNLPVINLDKVPGYDQEVPNQDLNPNRKLVVVNSKTKSTSYRNKSIKKSISSESEDIKKAREELQKSQRQIQVTIQKLRTYEQFFEKAVAQKSSYQQLYGNMVNNTGNILVELKKDKTRNFEILNQLLAQKRF